MLLRTMDPKARFTDCADAYAAHRPAYGDEVAAFVLAGLGDAPRVADLGAGTGISSRLLARHGAHVLAVEPNRAMRELAAADPGVTFVDGTAERTTLADGSVDAVTAFQAFHWFATPEALAEIRRIVRTGGAAALVVNERDPSDPFTSAYGAIVQRYATDDTERRRLESLHVFRALPGTVEMRTFTAEQRLDRDGLLGRTRSTSYLPHGGAAGENLEHEVAALFDRDACLGRVRLALVTWVVKVRLA